MLIDSHCHIPHKKYDKPLKDIVAEAIEAKVTHLISIGTSLKDSKNALEKTKEFENVFNSIGIYPHDDRNLSLEQMYAGLNELHHKYKHKIVAVGECGIDLTEWQDGRPLEDQLELFKLQIGFALEKDVPIIIHDRNGDEHILKILGKYKNSGLKGVVHCFSSNWEFATKMLDFGFYLSFAGMVTYPSVSKDILEVLTKVPSDRYLVETDAPYLPPQGHRGEINYSKYVKITAEKIAEVRKTTFAEVSSQTYKNTSMLFGLNL